MVEPERRSGRLDERPVDCLDPCLNPCLNPCLGDCRRDRLGRCWGDSPVDPSHPGPRYASESLFSPAPSSTGTLDQPCVLFHHWPMLSPKVAPFARTAALLVPIAAGLAASSMLLVDYVRPMPVFCADGGGCDALKHTTMAHAFGLPTPAIGIAGFVVLAALALGRGVWARRSLAVSSTLGALVALFLIGIQARFDVYCAFCMTVDMSTILLAAVAVYRWRSGWDIPPSAPLLTGAAAVWLFALLTPFIVGKLHKDVVPAAIAAELARRLRAKSPSSTSSITSARGAGSTTTISRRSSRRTGRRSDSFARTSRSACTRTRWTRLEPPAAGHDSAKKTRCPTRSSQHRPKS
jgi:uncharacterized membrane protein